MPGPGISDMGKTVDLIWAQALAFFMGLPLAMVTGPRSSGLQLIESNHRKAAF